MAGANGRPAPPPPPPPAAAGKSASADVPPHPPTVEGIKVVSARWPVIPPGHEDDPQYTGRTLLELKDGRKLAGCADCAFTTPGWTGVTTHRTVAHGAPPVRRGPYRTQQRELAVDAHTPEPEPVPAAREGVPAGMRLLDGISVPVEITGEYRTRGGHTVRLKGVRVKSVQLSDLDAGRTLLELDNGMKFNGCTECGYADLWWAKVASHRAEAHGGPPVLGRPRPRRGAPADAVALQLTAQSARAAAVAGTTPPPQPPQVLTPGQEDVLPPVVRGDLDEIVDKLHRRGVWAVTVGEVYQLADAIHGTGEARELLVEDRDKWKDRALKAERELRAERRFVAAKAKAILAQLVSDEDDAAAEQNEDKG